MAAAAGVHIEGLNELNRELQRLGVEVDDLKDVMASIAQLGTEEANLRVPRRTGRLAASIRGNRAKGKATIMAGRSSVPYAGPIEFGWPGRNISAAKYMTGAADKLAPRLPDMFEDGINDIIRKRGLA